MLHLISSSGLYGAEKMVVALCARLIELGAQPTLEVFHNRHSPNLEVAEFAGDHGVPVRRLECGGRFDPGAVQRLAHDIRAVDADLVHTHGYKSHLYGYLGSRVTRLPIVGTCHRFDQGPHNLLDRPLLRRFDAVLAVSREAEQSLNEAYRIPRGRTLTIPNGIDPAAYPAGRPRRSGPPVVGMVARLAPEKAPGDFLTAAESVLAVIPDAQFLIVGDGPLRADLVDRVGRLGMADRVEFTGFQDDIAEVYRSLDVLVQPSYREGMPMTMLEAMASGVPVIASDVGAAGDMIDDGRTGLLFPAGDVAVLSSQLLRLLADPDLRDAIGEAARADVANRFTDRRMAARYLAAYRDVLRSRGHA